ncbi:sensor histidine kinase [Paenibacillus yanchengensis]|uniref:histidine kinase n=1 Tax=Paenibacillus yanchengensis TaxID=2035833 RepID=A0ABW4YFB0_9BACL
MKSLQTKMVLSYLVLILLVVAVIGGLFITTLWNYYYGSTQSVMKQRAESALTVHGRILAEQDLTQQANYMLQFMAADRGATTIQLLQPSGELQMDSNGLANQHKYETEDVKEALAGQVSSWRGVDPYFQERVISVTVPVKNEVRIVSLLRYSSSLKNVDQILQHQVQKVIFIGIIVILLFLFVSLFFARKIVKPLHQLTRATKQMTTGDWTTRATVYGKDEISQLSVAFNMMMDELNKREKMKNDFISSISHELRTPLTSIKGWSVTLADDDQELQADEMKTGLQIIANETKRLSGLVEDLLDFSKLSSQSLQLNTDMVDLNMIVTATMNQFIVREEQMKIGMVAQLALSPIIVPLDYNRFKQVLINVMDNAFKFTDSGGSIRITTMIKTNSAVVMIADNGKGIAAEHMSHITEKFYKGNTTHSGSGLGLAISKEIMELHGGTLQIESELGAGTVVTLSLPLHL